MNQIPNIEETNTREVEEIKYKAKQMIDVNSIMPEVSIDEAVEYLAEQLLQTLHQQLQKAREEERGRNVKLINNIIQQSSDDSSDSWFNALRCARETIAHHSELDQDKK